MSITTSASADESSQSKLKVVIAGYYGSGNAGDEAILASLLGELRARFPGLDPVAVSADPERTAAAHGVRSVSKSDKPGLLAAVRDCDWILLGGGGLIQDYWRMDIGDLFRPADPVSYSAYAALAALFDKPLILYAVGVGPLATNEGRRYGRMICDEARLITVRDGGSKALLEELGVDGARVHVTADPAIRLAVPATVLRMERPIAGVAVRSWSKGVDSEAWEAELAAALDGFITGRLGSILFLPFEKSGAEDDDLAAAHRIRSRMRFGKHAAVLEAASGDPSQLAGAIAGCDVVVAMRYHAALFAIRSGIPAIGLVYDPKVRHLFTEAGAESYLVELGALRADILIARMEQALDDAELPGRLRPVADRLSEAASQNAGLAADALAGGSSRTSPVTAKVTRMWLDEVTAAASGAMGGAPELEAVQGAAADRRRGLGFPELYDVLCFPGIEWNFRWMRAQQLMSQFADRGHRVFFMSPSAFLASNGVKFAAHTLRGNVWEVRLAAPRAVDVYSGVMPDDVQGAIVDDVAALARDFGIGRAVSILHLATWSPAAGGLRARFGWPVVYDCMDDWSGFAWMPQALLDGELALARNAQLVITTAQKLWDKWSPQNRHTILARNAADIAHFQNAANPGAAVDLPASRTIVGFYGAIDSWFDVELVRYAATERPDYFFALIGAVYDAPVERLQEFPNVRFFGHQPYADLPAWLERFHACIIPFKINAVTEATDPVKFYEYLAQAKPVVATRLPELEVYREILYLADGPHDFLRLLDAAVSERDPQLRERRLAVAGENTWTARYERIDAAIRPALPAAPPEASRALKKILFVCPVLILGGVEVILKTRATELIRRGCEVRLAAMEEAGGQVLFEESGIDSRICPSEEEFTAEVTDFQPDWIVIIDAPATVPAARRTARQASIVYEVHSTYPHILAPLVDRGFLTGIRGIAVPSASQEARVRSLLAIDKPIEVVPNALAPAFFETAGSVEERADGPARPIVLWVGRLDSLKNWRAFVELATRLHDRTEAEFHLVSAGAFDETEGAELERAASGLNGRLQWIREVHHTEMPDLYRRAARSGGCLVSTSMAESFGMAVLEAMASHCPVVVPDIEGLRDLARPGETGWLYPAGDVAAACKQVVETLGCPPERRRHITETAYQAARQFSPEQAAERFLAALAAWSKLPQTYEPPAAVEPAPEPGLAQEREQLSRILAAHPEARIVIFPPSISWSASSISERPQQWARALAAHGCLVFYCDPQHLGSAFSEVEPRIVAANVALQVYDMVEAPVVMANAGSLSQIGHFRDPLVVYECLDSTYEEEWLARAAVVIVTSGEVRDAVHGWRPDALLVSAIEREDPCPALFAALENADARQKDPVRLKALLAWREGQINRLEAQIRERDRPAVDILYGAVTEQKRVISERDKGIAFLRHEVAGRDRIIAERETAVGFLQNEVRHQSENERHWRDAIEALQRAAAAREEDLAFLRQEAAARDQAIAKAEEGIRFLREEVAAREQAIAKAEEGIRFLREEVAAHEQTIASGEESIRLLREEAATHEEDIRFLREVVAAREQTIASSEEGIRFLRQEIAAREQTIASSEEGIRFLRQQIAEREQTIASNAEGIGFLREELAKRDQAITELESRLTWWRRRQWNARKGS